MGSADSIRSMWKYYQLPLDAGHESLNVRVTTIIGEVDIYVMKCPYQSYECAGTHGMNNTPARVSYFPTSNNYLYSTVGLDYDYLTVNRVDNTACSYIIGIQSTNMYSQYQISVTMENSVLSLQAGVTVSDHVDYLGYDYFSYDFSSTTSIPSDDDTVTDVQVNQDIILQITVTPVYGDPDVYISTVNSHPTATGNTTFWKSYSYGADTVLIHPFGGGSSSSSSVVNIHNTHECVDCTYYIAVFGARESAYSITVSVTHASQSTLIHVSDGSAVSGYVLANSFNYYIYYYLYTSGGGSGSGGLDRDIRIALSTTMGDADLYVNIGTEKRYNSSSNTYANARLPTVSQADYRSGDSGVGEDSITISHNDDAYTALCKALGYCIIRIGVYGFTESEYILSVSSSLASSLLLMNIPSTGSVSQGGVNLYRVMISSNNVNNTKGGARISITAYSGHVLVYALCKRLPSTNSNSNSNSNMPLSTASTVKIMPNSTNAMWSVAVDQTSSGSVLDIHYVDMIEHGCISSTNACSNSNSNSNMADDVEIIMSVMVNTLIQGGKCKLV